MSTNDIPTTIVYGSDASREAWAEVVAQGRIRPGTEGWWGIWGASVADIEAGDIVCSVVDGKLAIDLVEDTFDAKAAPMRRGLVIGGERLTLGALVRVELFRRGTCHKLANSVR